MDWDDADAEELDFRLWERELTWRREIYSLYANDPDSPPF